MCIGITENEPNGREEVALPGTIATNDDIVLGREGFNDGLILVAKQCPTARQLLQFSLFATRGCDIWDHSPFEALDDDLLDIHLDRHNAKVQATQRLEHHAVNAPGPDFEPCLYWIG